MIRKPETQAKGWEHQPEARAKGWEHQPDAQAKVFCHTVSTVLRVSTTLVNRA